MKPIVILGMHRSGTSAVTRALGLLGASMGPAPSMGEYWENKPMREVNEDLLKSFGGAWDCPPVLGEGWVESPEAAALLPRARQVLGEEYGDASVVVWKDPRTCITFPFWRVAFDEEPVVVCVHRHPVEVAGSLLSRNRMSPGHVFALWERYNADALVHTVGLPAAMIAYHTLVEDPTGTMTKLAGSLARWGVALANDPATTEMELSQARRHHQADADDSLADPIATESQRDLFALLGEVIGFSQRFSLPRPVPAPHPLSVDLLAFAARARESRADAWSARSELSRTIGSRRWLLRRLIDQTIPRARRP